MLAAPASAPAANAFALPAVSNAPGPSVARFQPRADAAPIDGGAATSTAGPSAAAGKRSRAFRVAPPPPAAAGAPPAPGAPRNGRCPAAATAVGQGRAGRRGCLVRVGSESHGRAICLR